MKHLLRKYEAKRAKYFRRKLHDAKHRFTCGANFMRRKARFIEKDRLQKQSVFFWWGRTDSLACGRATAGQTVHRTVCLDRPFESALQIPKRKKVQHQMVLDFFGGGGRIRTIEAIRSRFTVCPLWPLGNSPIFHCRFLEPVDGLEPPTY